MTKLPNPTLSAAIQLLEQRVRRAGWSHWTSRRLSATQRQILEYLSSSAEPVTVGAVAQQLEVTAATASDSLRALHTKRLVSRERNATDARAVLIQLTSEGHALMSELRRDGDPLERAVSTLSPSERAVYLQLTQKILEGFPPVNRSAPGLALSIHRRLGRAVEASGSTPHTVY